MKRFTYSSLFLLVAAFSLPADAIYNVSVNTSPYSGQAGYLDFQLGRGPDSQAASVSVSAFVSNGTLSASGTQVSGSVTGALPGVVTIGNATQFNDYFRAFTYGSTLSFQLTFSGPAINAPNGTSANGSPFGFGLYNSSQAPLGPTDGFGNAFLIQVNTNGTTMVQNFSTAASITGGSAAVPEPGAWGLLVAGLAALTAYRRRRAVN